MNRSEHEIVCDIDEPFIPILEMFPHGNVICTVSFIKKKPIVLAREYNVIKLIVQHGTSVSTAQLTKEQEQQKEYSRYNTNSKNNRGGYSGGRGRGSYGGGRGGRDGYSGRGRSNGSASGRDRYGRSNGGYGQQTDPTTGNRVKSTSLSFNVDELIAKTTQHTEKEIRRTLDRLRYQGEYLSEGASIANGAL